MADSSAIVLVDVYGGGPYNKLQSLGRGLRATVAASTGSERARIHQTDRTGCK